VNFFILFLFLLTVSFYILNEIFRKKNILIDNVDFSNHKKFTGEKGTPYSGGIFFLLLIFYLSEFTPIYNLTIFFLIFLIGFLSDLNKITSASIRIILQSILIISYILANDLIVVDTRFTLLDNILNDFEFIAVFFTFFCIIVLINGTNFIDGVNNLASGYYFVIFLNLIFLTKVIPLEIDQDFLIQILSFIIIFLIFNFFSQSFLGDNGSYLLGFFVGFYLISFYINQNNIISPYYIIVLLWYPAYENLFSIMRRLFFERKKVKRADNLHLHHLVYKFLSKFLGKNKYANSLTGILINFINLIIIFPGNFYASKTNILVGIIFVSLVVYNSAYFYLRFKTDKF